MSTAPPAVAPTHTAAAPPARPRSPTTTSTFTRWAVAISPASLSSSPRRRAVIARSAPRRARSRAIAAPMPLDAPVTSARRPASEVTQRRYHVIVRGHDRERPDRAGGDGRLDRAAGSWRLRPERRRDPVREGAAVRRRPARDAGGGQAGRRI